MTDLSMKMGYIMFHLYQRIHAGLPDDTYIKHLWDMMTPVQHQLWEYMAEKYHEAMKDHGYRRVS